jgi:hypothetical protein
MALAFFLITKNTGLTPVGGFTWISISIMYLALFSPFVFAKAHLFIMLLGVGVYVVASSAVAALLNLSIIPALDVAVFMQVGLLLLFAIVVFCAYFAVFPVGRYGQADRLASVRKLRSLAESVAFKVSDLPEEYGIVRKLLFQIAEDLRYIAPLKGNKGIDLEEKIAASLHFMGQYCDSAFEGGSVTAFEREARNLQVLVRQRKLL